MFVTSLKKNCLLKLKAIPWTPWDSLGAGGQNLALNSQSSPLALQFLVQHGHFMSSIEQVPVVPRADSSCTFLDP